METFEAYLDRKYEEITLLNDFLGTPLALRRPTSVAEVIEHKFHIAAALKADHALHDWALTETAWAHPGRLRAGPFEFSYDYQRADLEVRGPSFYQFDHSTSANQTIYTSSGMAAISALLLAFARLVSEADILALPSAYGETLELIENHARQFHLVPLKSSPDEVAPGAGQPRILLFDSCTPAAAFEATLHCARPRLDLVIFDTTCFSTGSGRIRRVVNWARRWEVPIALVRSHTKLDSLGVEYGRLGSAVFVACEKHVASAKQERLEDLASEMRNAVRLFGGAAVPAHFPPYVGTKAYRALTDRRMAAILRNSRRTARCFASGLAGSSAELHFAHGLYVTLAPKRVLDEKQTKQMAADLCDDLRRAGLPLRHAGSFGFDFGAAEWFRDTARNRHVVRIAVPDLPTPLWDRVAGAVAEWWSAHEEEKFQPAGLPTTAPV
ncbi:hypothetical protein [Bradyrhizobium australiense]|uniref:Cystathionine beta-lyase/cystathionine gamma-synthase n=1 Tax=Bradyrhizobium australiense TaxID=2721161 RepID=A0A7Y4GT79_9BRAD|nr:hypothetical protein [Bradyrhizobium australiense]NOJ41317.1 hypothetical protein [Bradyrhizobium australiense]